MSHVFSFACWLSVCLPRKDVYSDLKAEYYYIPLNSYEVTEEEEIHYEIMEGFL